MHNARNQLRYKVCDPTEKEGETYLSLCFCLNFFSPYSIGQPSNTTQGALSAGNNLFMWEIMNQGVICQKFKVTCIVRFTADLFQIYKTRLRGIISVFFNFILNMCQVIWVNHCWDGRGQLKKPNALLEYNLPRQ